VPNNSDYLVWGGAGLLGLGAVLYLTGKPGASTGPGTTPPPPGGGGGAPAPATPCQPIDYGSPPAGQAANWVASGAGWYPSCPACNGQPVPPGWVAGQVAPQPTNDYAKYFIWTGSAWIPNPNTPPPGWSSGRIVSSPIIWIKSIGNAPAGQATNWIKTNEGWYPQLGPNVPPGWVAGQASPQPAGSTANRFVWTGRAWVPNPSNMPAGWTL